MSAKNRLSISFGDDDFDTLDRLSAHTQKSKAELVRIIVHEYLEMNPNRFRRNTSIGFNRIKNIVFKSDAHK